MTTTLTDQSIVRISDCLCVEHSATADYTYRWPFSDGNLQTPKRECRDCATAAGAELHDICDDMR